MALQQNPKYMLV